MILKIAHLSDLHFGRKLSASGEDISKHSEMHCQAISKIISKEKSNLELVIISGDISDSGDSFSLRDAKTWIRGVGFQKNGNPLTFGLDEDNYHKLRIIPGNHDAYNYHKVKGDKQMIHQNSLKNFNEIFFEDKIGDEIRFDWIEFGTGAVFICYVDSSFLGEQVSEVAIQNIGKFDKLAKGRFSLEKSEQILKIFDKGINGSLLDPIQGANIDKGKFKDSLKIIVMHHYLFEPPGFNIEPLLQISYKNSVFANIAMADFDILLCGHKHISNIKGHKYVNHFNKRAKARYLLNYFRRLLGIEAMPVQYLAEDGKKISKLTSIAISIGLKKQIQEDNSNDNIVIDFSYLDKVVNLLTNGISDPDKFDYHINRFLLNDKSKSIDKKELLELSRKIKFQLSDEERFRLGKDCANFSKVISNLTDRQFLQIMAGSACKSREKKVNAFNIYEIKKVDGDYHICSKKFNWNEEKSDFLGPEESIHIFNSTNRPFH